MVSECVGYKPANSQRRQVPRNYGGCLIAAGNEGVMAVVYRCDRCQRLIEVAWEVKYGVEQKNSAAQYVPPKSAQICNLCEGELSRFLDGFGAKATDRRPVEGAT